MKERQKPGDKALRFYQHFSPNPENRTYSLYCKFQLLRYKPWVNCHSDALGVFPDSTKGWVDAWTDFLRSDLGKSKVPSWQSLLSKAETFLNDNEFDNEEMDREEDADTEQIDQEDWMINQNRAEIQLPPVDSNSELDSLNYWAQDRKFYTDQELSEMSSWLDNEKKNSNPNQLIINNNFNSSTLNTNQLIAFNIVKDHLEQNKNEQLLLRMEGPGGWFIFFNL